MSQLINLLIFYHLMSSNVESFNVDVQFPLKFTPESGISSSSENYFGASVAIHSNFQQIRFLIGAPKSYSINSPSLRTGSVYDCQLINTTTRCDTIQGLQSRSPYAIDEMFLGGSVSSKDQSTMSIACGHLRINEFVRDSSYPNGACQLIKFNGQARFERLIEPLRDRDAQIVSRLYYFSHGMAGFSSLFIKGNGLLVLGAPGFWAWRGAIVVYTPSSSYSKPLVRHANSPPDSYFGYSLASGQFFRDKNVYIATGAPREGDNGAVYYFLANNLLGSNSIASINSFQILKGHDIGEYFGSSILSTDINADGMDDLIVGAPFFSPENARKGDIGRVFVYLSNDVGFSNPQIIYGDRKHRARFGSSLSDLGDLNFDGFQDLVIGAPFEDDGRGAIYIYLGQKFGLSERYSQKISSEQDFPSMGLKSFGYSVSNGIDVDGNKYPDILVGAPISGHALVLRSRPIGELKIYLRFDPFSIDMTKQACKNQQNDPVACFNVTYCLNLRGKYLDGKHRVNVTLEVDTLLKSEGMVNARGYFDDYGKKYRLINRESAIPINEEVCERPILVLMNKEVKDKLTPMEFTLKYQLVDKSSSFCPSCPQLTRTTAIRDQITFETGCGGDDQCISDVSIKLSLLDSSGLKTIDSVVEGYHGTVVLKIFILNAGENAHSAKIMVSVTPGLKSTTGTFDMFETNGTTLSFSMDVGNPLEPGITEFLVPFDLKSSPLEHPRINFTCHFSTRSAIKSQNSLRDSISIPIQRYASLEVLGYESEPAFFEHPETRSKDHERFTLLFTVIKSNYSSIRRPVVSFNFPISFRNTLKLIYKPRIESLDSTTLSCDFNGLDLEPFPMEEDFQESGSAMSEALKSDEPSRREKRSLDNQQVQIDGSGEQILNLDCGHFTCKKIECRLGSFGTGQRVVNIRIISAVNLKHVETLFARKVKISNYSVQAEAIFLDEMVQGHGKWSEVVVSEILLKQLPHKEEIALWVIIVCSIVGLAFLLLIIFALIKVGFFKRKKREELKVLTQRYSCYITPNMLNNIEMDQQDEDDDEEEPRGEEEAAVTLRKPVET